jgi:hypothetical protein
MYYWADCNDEKLFVWALQGVAINFVRKDDIRILRDIEQYYSTQIDEMPMNVADLIWATAPRKVWLGVAVRSGREGLCNLSGAEICLFTFLVTAWTVCIYILACSSSCNTFWETYVGGFIIVTMTWRTVLLWIAVWLLLIIMVLVGCNAENWWFLYCAYEQRSWIRRGWLPCFAAAAVVGKIYNVIVVGDIIDVVARHRPWQTGRAFHSSLSFLVLSCLVLA